MCTHKCSQQYYSQNGLTTQMPNPDGETKWGISIQRNIIKLFLKKGTITHYNINFETLSKRPHN